MQLGATKQELQETKKERSFFSRHSDGALDCFEYGFGTELGAGLLWRRVPSGSLMLAAWSHQATAAGEKQETKKEIFFLGIQKGR